MQNGTTTLKDSLEVSYKTKCAENLFCTKTCTQMFIALYGIAKTWKQPTEPSAGKWEKQTVAIQTRKYYPGLKWSELSSLEKTRRKLKSVLLSDTGQTEKVTYCMILTIGWSGKGKTVEPVKWSSGCQWLYGGRNEQQSTRDFQGSETPPCDNIVMDTNHCTFVPAHRKYVIRSDP